MGIKMVPPKSATRINLACGRRALPGWINIDISLNIPLSKIPFIKWVLFKLRLIPEEAYKMKWPKGTIWHDVRKGLPFRDGTVEWIYSSHFLEHVKKEEAEKILRECYRVLKSGGRIRIVVPDLEVLAKKYIKGDVKFFGLKNTTESTADKFLEILNFFPKERWQRICAGQYHLWMYDFNSLSRMLKACGFKNIERKELGKSTMPDIKKLGEPSGYDLCVEAQK